jgi:hypothetical protein
MSGKEFEQGYILGYYGGVEKGAGGMSAYGTSNGKGTVIDAANGGTQARFINGFDGLSGVGGECCVLCGQRAWQVQWTCVRKVREHR